MTIPCDAVHVGMPKAASSFLQRVGFPRHPEIACIWEPRLRLYFELRDRAGTPDFDLEDYRRRLREHVERRIGEGPAGRKVVLSFEGFCGPQWTVGNDRAIAETLRDLLGPVRVILVLREPYAMLYALWTQYVREGGTRSLASFLRDPGSPARPHDPENGIFVRVRHDRYLGILREIFGEDRVGMFFFEEFVRTYEAFLSGLYAFLGVRTDVVPENEVVWRGFGFATANLYRRLNALATTPQGAGPLPAVFHRAWRALFQRYVLPSRLLNPGRKPEIRSLVPEERRREIRRANARLGELTGRDVAALGYAS